MDTEYIEAVMRRNRLSQASLARKMKMNPCQVSYLLRRRLCSLKTGREFAEALNTTLECVLDEEVRY